MSTAQKQQRDRPSWHYVRIRNAEGRVIRECFKTRSLKRAQLYKRMYPEAVIETVKEA